MGLRDFLKKHESKDDDDDWEEDPDKAEGIAVEAGGMFKALKDFKKRKS